MDLVGFLYGFGLLQGLILAAGLIWVKSDHRLANGFMAGLVTVIAAGLLQNWLVRTGYFFDHPHLSILISPLDFSWGPLLYLYAYTLTQHPLSWKQGLHFVPTLVLFSGVASFMTLSPDQQLTTIRYLWSVGANPELRLQAATAISPVLKFWIDFHLQGNLFVLQMVIYCFLVLRLVKNHNRRMEQHFSSLDAVNINWLRKLVLACLLFLAVFVIFNRSQVLQGSSFDVNALVPSIPHLFLVGMIYVGGVVAIFQPSLIRGVSEASASDPGFSSKQESSSAPVSENENPDLTSETEDKAEEAPVKATKYERSGLSIEDAEAYKIRLMKKMQEDELYLNCELTLPDLARETNLTAHQVSQVLNGQMNQNFFSFVNNYRIQLAKSLLSDPETQNTPIVELALEVGFKSKSSFYDAFKKATQMTPTQFKNSVNNG